MSGAPPAAVEVVTGVERLLDQTRPTLLQSERSWVKTRGSGWPPPELIRPELRSHAVPDWSDCDIGIRIGHDTDSELDITIGVGRRHAVVGGTGGRITLPVTSHAGVQEVVDLVDNALHTQYVWENHFRGQRLVRWEEASVGIDVEGTEGRHVHRSFRARRAWLRLLQSPRVERRVVTYGLQSEHG